MIEQIEAPAVSRSCRMTIVMPAKDEADTIMAALTAFAAQSGRADFDIIVLANNCADATASRARAVARRYRQLAIHVIETTLPPPLAHVGHARKLLMDCAARRFSRASTMRGIIASADADTIVAHDWVDRMFEEMQSADAVAALVTVRRSDQRAMPAPVRLLYERELAFRRVWTDLESLIDPRPEDPPPRHGAFVGASFAVSADTYVRAGGLPQVACLEDREFLFALRRIDAKIRFSPNVRAYTSGRRVSRVHGGFGTFISHLYNQGQTARQSFLVEDPRQIIAELEGRAAIRRIWLGESSADDLNRLSEIFTVAPAACAGHVDRSVPFGSAYERFVTTCGRRRPAYGMVSVEDATEALCAAVAQRNAAAPTRSSTASGAG
jgi:glycosyltransferase involved in cell wall biosynthesis